MTQPYSNLVYYVSNTTYLCLVLVVLGSPKVSWVRLASLHTAVLPLPVCIMHNLARIPLFLIPEDKGGPTHGHKTKRQHCSMEAGISCFTIFGKDVSGWRKYIEPRSKHQLFYYEQNLGYTTSPLKIFYQ